MVLFLRVHMGNRCSVGRGTEYSRVLGDSSLSSLFHSSAQGGHCSSLCHHWSFCLNCNMSDIPWCESGAWLLSSRHRLCGAVRVNTLFFSGAGGGDSCAEQPTVYLTVLLSWPHGLLSVRALPPRIFHVPHAHPQALYLRAISPAHFILFFRDRISLNAPSWP